MGESGVDVFALRNWVVADYARYVQSFVRIRDERLRDYVDQQMAGGAHWADPLIQLSPAYAGDEERRHRLRCELDAVFAHLNRLDRPDLEWILDAPNPSAALPCPSRNEMRHLGECRTQQCVLHAYDQMARREAPVLDAEERAQRDGKTALPSPASF